MPSSSRSVTFKTSNIFRQWIFRLEYIQIIAFTVECPANQITKNGNCEDCPNAGEVPNADALSCTACPSHQFTNNGNCQNCPKAGEIPSSDRLTCTTCQSNEYTDGATCKTCQTGEVPNTDRLGCEKCPTSQIAADGNCKPCTNGEIPNSDQTICIAGTKQSQFVPLYSEITSNQKVL